jgi:nucleoside-diphosphate-sugar epimerase
VVTTPTSTPSQALTERKLLSIFITGGSSPLGLAVIRALVAAGHQVAAHTSGAKQSTVIRDLGGLPVYADLARLGELKSIIAARKCEVVINLATQVANHIPFARADWMADSLVTNTETLLTAAAEAGAKFYVHTSYAFVYGDHHGAWVDETSRPEPGEHELLKAALRAEKKAISGAIPGCVLRLGYVYGADSNVLQGLVETLRAGRPVVAGEGYANWINADDAAEAIRRAAEAQIAGGIYNIVDGTPASPMTFLNNFGAAMGLSSISRAPKFLAGLFAPKTQNDLMTLSARAKNGRAVEELGWYPRFNSHQAGLDDVMLTWRAREQRPAPVMSAETAIVAAEPS